MSAGEQALQALAGHPLLLLDHDLPGLALPPLIHSPTQPCLRAARGPAVGLHEVRVHALYKAHFFPLLVQGALHMGTTPDLCPD